MKKYIIRTINGFLCSAVVSMLCLLLVEVISAALGNRINPMTPDFISYFPSETIALEVDILLYGIFGASFAGMSFVYDNDRLGFVVQNIIYCLCTAAIWIPIITFIWQLWRYPMALVCTIAGFAVTYVIMTVVAYKTTKNDISEVNRLLVDLKK